MNCIKDNRKHPQEIALCGKKLDANTNLSIEQWLNGFLDGSTKSACEDCSSIIKLALKIAMQDQTINELTIREL